jgi:L-2,4-diaminobutyric acid acetyltransferase
MITVGGYMDIYCDIKVPSKEDGSVLWQIARESGSLDLNSSYAYLLMVTHFAHTSAIAYFDGEAVGFVSGYFCPDDPGNLFIWQIAVRPQFHSKGIAYSLLLSVLKRHFGKVLHTITTTVSPSNTASLALFTKISHSLYCEMSVQNHFLETDFPDTHEREMLITIGPVGPITQED